MPKRVSYNSVKSTNKTLSQSKFRYLHLHRTPVFVLLSAAALKACGGGGGSSGGGTQDGSGSGSVSFAPNRYSLVSVDDQSDNSFTISENSQPVLRDDVIGGKSYYYLLGSVSVGVVIDPVSDSRFSLENTELYFVPPQKIVYDPDLDEAYNIVLRNFDSGVEASFNFKVSDVPQDEEYKIHDAANDALSSVYEVDEVIEGGNNDVIAIFSVSSDTASVVLSLEGADKDDFDFNNGELIFKNAPDFETKSEYELILVSTQGEAIVKQNFKVSVLDVDEAPVITSDVPDAASTTFDENVEVDTLIVTLAASDPDDGDDISWSIVLGNDEGLFAIGSDTGELVFSESPDFEIHGASRTLTIRASSTGSSNIEQSAEQVLTITINDANEAPIRNDKTEYLVSGNLNLADANSELVFDVSELISRFDDPEGDAINAIVFDTNSPDYGMFTITYNSDSDGSGSYVDLSNNTLTLADDDISDDTIKIVVKQGVSPEIGRKSLSYSVQDVSSMSLSPETLFGFEVTASGDQIPSFNVGLNEGIVNTDSSHNSVSNIITIKLNENEDYTTDSLLATISASDTDTPQDEVVLSVKDDILPNWLSFDVLTTDASMGTINVLSGADFDYEDENLFGLDDGGKVYSFTISATESDRISSELKVNIEIVDVDEAPVIVQPDSDTFIYGEGVVDAGASIVDLDASDPDDDDDDDDISWSIVSGNDDGLFTINSDTGDLYFSASPDFETHDASRTLTIEASSGPSGNLQTDTLEVHITINDVDEAPVIVQPDSDTFTRNENVTAGTSIVDLDASDDALDVITWSIVSGNDDGLFAIGSDTGELVFDKSPDFEELNGGTLNGDARAYALTIRASSIGSSGEVQTGALELTITINDKDEAPVIATPALDAFDENVEAGTSIVDLDASDPDDDYISWSIVLGNDEGLFAIDSSTGILSFKESPDFETHGASRTLTIEASSGPSGNLQTDTLEVHITINDVDEAPVIATPALDAFDENVEADTSIVDLDASDDALDVITWSIFSGNDDDLFDINSDTGELVFDKSPDFETHGASRSLIIQASSIGSSRVEKTGTLELTITINDVDEANGLVEWSRGDVDLTLTTDKTGAADSISLLLKGTAANPIDFSDLEFSRDPSDATDDFDSTSITITIPESSTGADDGGVITIGYTDFASGYDINADILRFDGDGDGIVDDDFELPLLKKRSFTAWNERSINPTVTGTDEAELIIGSSLSDYIIGLSGDDYIYGGAGNDKLDGHDGNDHLYGGAGNDKLYGRHGNDKFYGGADNDKYYYLLGDGNDTIYEDVDEGDADVLILQGINDVLKFERYSGGTPAQDGNDLRIVFNNIDASYITLKNSFNDTQEGVEQIHFDTNRDGVVDAGEEIWYDDDSSDPEALTSFEEALDIYGVNADDYSADNTAPGSVSVDSGTDGRMNSADDVDRFNLDGLSVDSTYNIVVEPLASDGVGEVTYSLYRDDGSATPEMVTLDNNGFTAEDNYDYYIDVSPSSSNPYIGGYRVALHTSIEWSRGDGDYTLPGKIDAADSISLLLKGTEGNPLDFSDLSFSREGTSDIIDGEEYFDSTSITITIPESSTGADDGGVITIGYTDFVAPEYDINADILQFDGDGDGNTDIELSLLPQRSFTRLFSPDIITVTGNDEEADLIIGSSLRDVIQGYSNDDYIYSLGGWDFLYGGAGNDELEGGAGDDTIYGGDDRDFLYGNEDNDKLYGGAGNDSLYGGIGNDILYGGEAIDTLFGEVGDDYLNGGVGDDHLYGGAGVDTIYGGAGNDKYYYSLGDGNDIIYEDADEGDADVLILQGISSTNDFSKFERYNGDTLDPDGNDLRITFNDADASYITLRQSVNSDSAGVDEIHFDTNSDGVKDVGEVIWYDDDSSDESLISFEEALDIYGVNADDYSADNTNPGSVSVGSALDGLMNSADDVDRFNLEGLSVGKTYTIIVEPLASLSVGEVTYSLYRDDGSATPEMVTHSNGIFTAEAGSYYIEVTSSSNPYIGGYRVALHTSIEWSRGDGDYTLPGKTDAADSISLLLKGTAANPIDFSDLSFSRQESGTTSPLDSTSITITIPESSTGADDGGVITIGYTDFVAPEYDINADILQFDGDGDGNTDIELSLLPQRSFTRIFSPDIITVTGNDEEADLIIGSSLGDVIHGYSNDDYIYSLGGSDFLYGGAGNDELEGGEGDDDLYGGVGDDELEGGEGDDYIYGGAGDDSLYGGIGNDILYGHDGNDKYYYSLGNGNDIIYEDADEGDADVLILQGISSTNDLAGFYQNGNDLKIVFNDADASYITLRQGVNSDSADVDEIHFDTNSDGVKDVGEVIWYDDDSSDESLISFEEALDIYGVNADDYSADSTNPGSVSVGSEIDGRINSATDVDRFNLEGLSVGKTYTIIVEPLASLSVGEVTYSLYRDDGSATPEMVTLDNNGFTAEDNYDYYIDVSPSSSNPYIGGYRVALHTSIEWSRGDGDYTLPGKTDTADSISLLLKGTPANPLDFSDLVFNREPSSDISPLISTSITITIPESSTGAADGGVITIGYSLGDEMNADRLRFDKDGDGIVDDGDFEIPVLPQRSFTERGISVHDDATVSGTDEAELIIGSSLRDKIEGGEGDDYIYSLGSFDYIYGEAGDDTIYGGDGVDNLEGGVGDDFLYGGEGNDQLYGGTGDDKIYGKGGVDYLYGDVGNDELYGGAGNDDYRYNLSHGNDTIIELEGEGIDRLIIRNISINDVSKLERYNGDTLSLDGNDLRIIFNDDSYITLKNSFNTTNEGVEQIHFADGIWYHDDSSYESLISFSDALDIYGVDGTDPGSVSVGSALYGRINSADDEDSFNLEGLFAGKTYTVVFEQLASLSDGEVTYNFYRDDGSGTPKMVTHSNGVFTVIETGSYYIEVMSSPTLPYIGGYRASLFEGVVWSREAGNYTLPNKTDAADEVTLLLRGTDANPLDFSDLEFSRQESGTTSPLDSTSITITIDGGSDITIGYTDFGPNSYDINADRLQIDSNGNGDIDIDLSLFKERSFTTWDGTSNTPTVPGTAGAELIVGSSLSDYIIGLSGDDYIYGGAGNDKLDSHDGNDHLYGGAGDDYLSGGADNDRLYGGAGDDYLYGGSGNDELYGGDDNDNLDGGNGSDTLYGGAGVDTISGGAGVDTIYGDANDDILYGGADNDILEGGAGNDNLYGDDGNDKLYGGEGGDSLRGGAGDDRLEGGAGVDHLYGGDDNDHLYGDANDDKLYGHDGDDYLYGGVGDDYLYGGVGDDILYGGTGDDEYRYSSNGNDTIYEDVDEGADVLILNNLRVSKFERYNGNTLDPTGNDLRITLNDDDASYITLKNSFNSDSAGIDEIHFENDNDGVVDTKWFDEAFSTYLT